MGKSSSREHRKSLKTLKYPPRSEARLYLFLLVFPFPRRLPAYSFHFTITSILQKLVQQCDKKRVYCLYADARCSLHSALSPRFAQNFPRSFHFTALFLFTHCFSHTAFQNYHAAFPTLFPHSFHFTLIPYNYFLNLILRLGHAAQFAITRRGSGRNAGSRKKDSTTFR